ncbi:MAG: D-glycero-beta-D-manno-heptose 1-phosphate adenylyltransferase [Saprospiraceae bacterium]|jgi:rfaE bifunctional protein nucleotidyltransferase chain/domain|nr:D-glycero-beta-D-manno-heptose 1-phosphate adenylyltransferase [Saprospiraceae bacterium]MBP9210225.1 D-glycero-beta-D-manno-heptose 1-phosphate adenylyltransferase [Saprospiraceae bacterium]MBV6472479.1 Bifunctional protein HldE [Saprospiraceae bacterium]
MHWSPERKIHTQDALLDIVSGWRRQGLRCVFTNGCFDILHEGHVRYLSEARGLGDRLVVGLNADESVRRLKGPSRPVNREGSRALVVAALAAVDAVVLFGEDTPAGLIEKLSPDILVKGGDWPADQIAGADWVLSHGGKVFSLQFHDGFSTTSLMQKIQSKP